MTVSPEMCRSVSSPTPEALLRLIRQHWIIENEWHWARDAQLGEDAHRTSAPVFSFLRRLVMNLMLLRGGYRSIRQPWVHTHLHHLTPLSRHDQIHQ